MLFKCARRNPEVRASGRSFPPRQMTERRPSRDPGFTIWRDRGIEALIACPSGPFSQRGEAIRPDGVHALLIAHGHQFPERPGARGAVPPGAPAKLTSQDSMLGAVSQAGYGAGDGPPDFCGPRT